MMSIVIGLIGLAAATSIFWLVRRDQLHVNHALGWIIVAGLFAVLGLAPTVVDYVALRLGIAYPPTLALSLGIVILTVKILLMDIERSRSEVALHRVTQKLAIQEARLDALCKDESVSARADSEPDTNAISAHRQ